MASACIMPSVSIHTPVWGVTNTICCKVLAIIVSIHTPVWGVTDVLFSEVVEDFVFQSTRPCGA